MSLGLLVEGLPSGWSASRSEEERLRLQVSRDSLVPIALVFMLLGLIGTPLALLGLANLDPRAQPGTTALICLVLAAAGAASFLFGFLSLTERTTWQVAPNSLEVIQNLPGRATRRTYLEAELALVRDDWSPQGNHWSLWLVQPGGSRRLARIEGLLPAFAVTDLLARTTLWPLSLVLGSGSNSRLQFRLQPRQPQSAGAAAPDAPQNWGSSRDFAGLAYSPQKYGTGDRTVVLSPVSLLWRNPGREPTPLGTATWHDDRTRASSLDTLQRLATAFGTYLVEEQTS